MNYFRVYDSKAENFPYIDWDSAAVLKALRKSQKMRLGLANLLIDAVKSLLDNKLP